MTRSYKNFRGEESREQYFRQERKESSLKRQLSDKEQALVELMELEQEMREYDEYNPKD